MHISLLLMNQIIQLFIMIFMGFIIVKAKLLKAEDSKILSVIVLYLIIPCVIINAFQVDYTPQTVKGLLIALAGSVMTQVILLIVVSILGRVFHLNEVEVASIYYSNSGNLIVPIVTFILGKEWVLYGCVFMSVQLVFIWTHCKKIISRESTYDWRKIVLNINMISIAIGIVLFLTRIHLPAIINNTLSAVGSMIGPASMIVTGMLFAGMMIVFLAIITPSASTVTQMCQVYGNDSQYASAINVVTTLLAIVTMPLMVMLFQIAI